MMAEEVLSDALLEFCESEYLSEEGLREIIDELTPNNNLNVSNYGFFLAACKNEHINEGILRILLEYFPESARGTDDEGRTPLHLACRNKNITLDIIQLLIDATPDSIRSVNNNSQMPLHILCCNMDIDETAAFRDYLQRSDVAIEILKLFLEKCPESIRHADNHGYLPIHHAAGGRPPEFCRVLIEAYPGSERISDDNGFLPLHRACALNTLATVEFLYNLYPDAINHQTTNGEYPILGAIFFGNIHPKAAAVDIVRFLLDCNPNVKLQKLRGSSLLGFACGMNAKLQIIKVIYDTHPEAIEDDRFVFDIRRFHQRVQTFINGESVHARQARDHRLMTTPDENGQLPLHHALKNNVRLGSIKLLVKGNPSAIRCADTNSVFPLHLACQHHDSPTVVQYLLDLDVRTLRHEDYDGNTALHYACSGAKYGTIAMLLEKYDAVSVSKRNAQGKLPIDLLCESDKVEDRESTEYTESVFRLLRAYPELLVSVCIQMRQSSVLDAHPSPGPSEIGKKRKFVHE